MTIPDGEHRETDKARKKSLLKRKEEGFWNQNEIVMTCDKPV